MQMMRRRRKSGKLSFCNGPRESRRKKPAKWHAITALGHYPASSPLLDRFAKHLRAKATDSEKLLWETLQRAKTTRFDFQVPIFGYVVDFYCHEHRLVVELDGSAHIGRERQDKRRENALIAGGLTVLRIRSSRVFSDLKGVLAEIGRKVKESESRRDLQRKRKH